MAKPEEGMAAVEELPVSTGEAEESPQPQEAAKTSTPSGQEALLNLFSREEYDLIQTVITSQVDISTGLGPLLDHQGKSQTSEEMEELVHRMNALTACIMNFRSPQELGEACAQIILQTKLLYLTHVSSMVRKDKGKQEDDQSGQ